MAKCWEQRGCDEEMRATCPHNMPGHQCPTKCAFAQCDRPSHGLTTDPALIFDPSVDRSAAIREECTMCAFFIKNGPRVG
jgi:hypothetical protein